MEDWQVDVINFEVKAIETFLGIKFTGGTMEDKQKFVKDHVNDRRKATSELMAQGYQDYIRGER